MDKFESEFCYQRPRKFINFLDKIKEETEIQISEINKDTMIQEMTHLINKCDNAKGDDKVIYSMLVLKYGMVFLKNYNEIKFYYVMEKKINEFLNVKGLSEENKIILDTYKVTLSTYNKKTELY